MAVRCGAVRCGALQCAQSRFIWENKIIKKKKKKRKVEASEDSFRLRREARRPPSRTEMGDDQQSGRENLSHLRHQ